MSEFAYQILCWLGITVIVGSGINTVVRTKRVWMAGKWITGKEAVIWGWINITVGLILLASYLYIF